MSTTTEQLLTAEQLAQRWQVSRAHIFNLMSRGMPSLKIGRARRFDIGAAEAWLAVEGQ